MVVFVAPESRAQKGDEAKKGSWEKIKVHGKSLEGNLEGDSPDRDVFVYLPPGYAASPNRRYPVVYFLHGYAAHAETYWKSLSVPAAADAAIADGSAHEMLLVLPDAFTVYDGSMFSNSPTTGDWEAFVAKDLIGYIDGHYRTIAERGFRGLAGHSMGGYGTVRIGMKHPGGLLGALCDEFLLPDERPAAAASGGIGEPAAEWGFGARAFRASRSVGARHTEPAAVFRSSRQRGRNPAAHRGKMDGELAPPDGRSVCAWPEESIARSPSTSEQRTLS